MLMTWSASVGSTLQVLLTVRVFAELSGKSGLIESVAGLPRSVSCSFAAIIGTFLAWA